MTRRLSHREALTAVAAALALAGSSGAAAYLLATHSTEDGNRQPMDENQHLPVVQHRGG